MFISVSRYCVWFPGYIYNVCIYLSNIHFENISTFFPDQKSMETRKKYIHTGARKRGEKKKQKAGIKWEKEGKRGKPRIELVERKGEERQSEKESNFTRIRIQSACGFRASRIPSVTYFQSLSRYFPSHEICFKRYYMRMNERKSAKCHHFRYDFSEWGARVDALPRTHDSRIRVKKKTALLGKRKFIPYIDLTSRQFFLDRSLFIRGSKTNQISNEHGDPPSWVTKWKLRKI